MNCSASKLHFSTHFFGSWTENCRIASGPILVPESRLNLWSILPVWKLEWHMPVQTLRVSLSLVPPLPVHPLEKWQAVWNRKLKVLILQLGRLLVKSWNGEPVHQKMKNEVHFRILSRSHGVPSSGFPMHVLAAGRFLWTWRIGTHGMGPTQYYFIGSAFAHPTSPIPSFPRVSSLMSHPAVDLDVVNPGCITTPEWICKNFSIFHYPCCCWGFFFFEFIFIMGFRWFSMLCLCHFTPIWFTYREISINAFFF